MGATSYRLGLTGGIGSGKSTVSQYLQQMGAFIIDADAISQASTAAGGTAMAAIRSAFGSAAVTEDGALDRAHMRSLVYADPGAKTRLEAIIHPLVGEAIAEQARQAELAGARCTVFDIPLLVESGRWRAALDRILVVDCTEETQVARVMARNGLQAAEIQRIITAQASRAQRLAAADTVLFNDGITLDALRAQVHGIGAQFGL